MLYIPPGGHFQQDKDCLWCGGMGFFFDPRRPNGDGDRGETPPSRTGHPTHCCCVRWVPDPPPPRYVGRQRVTVFVNPDPPPPDPVRRRGSAR